MHSELEEVEGAGCGRNSKLCGQLVEASGHFSRRLPKINKEASLFVLEAFY